MIPAIGLLVGIVLGLLLQPTVPVWVQPYLPIAVVAALDAVFGAFRSVLDGLFNDRIFVISFLSNVLVAAVIVFLGDQLGVGSQMSTGVVVVLTMRIFANVAAIRRHLLKAYLWECIQHHVGPGQRVLQQKRAFDLNARWYHSEVEPK